MDDQKRQNRRRQVARKRHQEVLVTASERQLEWSEAQKSWTHDVAVAKLVFQAFGQSPVDWDDDDVYVRLGV